jgi:Ca2+-binding RTX toxin-like protein
MTIKFGDNSSETITGSSSSDLLVGNGGDDKIYAFDNHDLGIGDGINDEFSFKEGEEGIPPESERIGDDTLYGGSGEDALLGNKGNDELYGDRYDYYYDWGGYSDYLSGGEGKDYLDGGSDYYSYDYYDSYDQPTVDTLSGGAGEDTFVLHTDHYYDEYDEYDYITDFEGSTDKMLLPYGVDFHDLKIVNNGVDEAEMKYIYYGSDLLAKVNVEETLTESDFI